jgi:mono/diheme cytochrome c family protein
MAVVTAAMFCMAGGALAQSGPDLGKREYEMNCAVCHGLNGKGAGAYTDFLKKTPADLTTISKRNGGVFPLQRVYDVIDGRGVEIKAHGPRDMPIWGADYSSKAGEHLEYYPEAFARTRILALIDYLYRIQTK